MIEVLVAIARWVYSDRQFLLDVVRFFREARGHGQFAQSDDGPYEIISSPSISRVPPEDCPSVAGPTVGVWDHVFSDAVLFPLPQLFILLPFGPLEAREVLLAVVTITSNEDESIVWYSLPTEATITFESADSVGGIFFSSNEQESPISVSPLPVRILGHHAGYALIVAGPPSVISLTDSSV